MPYDDQRHLFSWHFISLLNQFIFLVLLFIGRPHRSSVSIINKLTIWASKKYIFLKTFHILCFNTKVLNVDPGNCKIPWSRLLTLIVLTFSKSWKCKIFHGDPPFSLIISKVYILSYSSLKFNKNLNTIFNNNKN